MNNTVGYIHSVESFGTVDGPGVRFVVFLQGCILRCLYCHNPDTWKRDKGKTVYAEKLIEQFLRNKSFYKNGGITVTGGEPLLQIDFLIELFSLAKEENIHTCIDTSGATFNRKNVPYTDKVDTLLNYTDLVLLDIKHINTEKHKKLTGMKNEGILDFSRYLDEKNIPVWIRHVVVPGLTDNERDLENLGRFIGTLSNVEALDVLPYHTMGAEKYKKLKMDYPLKDLMPLSENDAMKAKTVIIKGILDTRK